MQRLLLVDFLALTFGVGAWVAINGLWVELPLLVQDLPEGWNLPSYMSIIVQIANIGPIAYSLLHLLRPSIGPSGIIYIVLGIGCTSSLLLSIFWDETSMIGGSLHSTAFLILVFFLSLVDCTSSVLYIPYMAAWRDIYLPSYLIGEGLSGLFPALVALGQGVGGKTKCTNYTGDNGEIFFGAEPLEPNFSIDIFFYIIFAMMIASTLGYFFLQSLPMIQKERSPQAEVSAPAKESTVQQFESRSNLVESTSKRMNKHYYVFLLAVQAWSSMLSNGFMPSIQSYSCGPYGTVTYHLAATLSALANPMAAFSTMILPRAKPLIVGALSGIATLISFYGITTAVMSPSPPLMEETMGSILVIVSWVVFTGVITYVRVEIANILRDHEQNALFWSGAVTQAGAAVGAIISFFLVNKTNIFQSYNPC